MFTSIIQIPSQSFKYELLTEKQPVIIENNDIQKMFDKFPFGFNIKKRVELQNDNWNTVRQKHFIMHAVDYVDIMIYPPYKKHTKGIPDPNENILTIQLSPGQTLILPYKWIFNVDISKIQSLGVNDFISWLF